MDIDGDDFLIQYALGYVVREKSEIAHFKYGPYVGLEAIKRLFKARNSNDIYQEFVSEYNMNDKLLEDIKEKLLNFDYDGEMLDNIILYSTENLALKIKLRKEINTIEAPPKTRILTANRTHTLPKHKKTDKPIPSSELIPIHNSLLQFNKYPLKRQQFEQLIDKELLGNYTIDDVISSLIHWKFI